MDDFANFANLQFSSKLKSNQEFSIDFLTSSNKRKSLHYAQLLKLSSSNLNFSKTVFRLDFTLGHVGSPNSSVAYSWPSAIPAKIANIVIKTLPAEQWP
ncbi:unnamed protein product [[Candida] boidinii]|nr:unnamed protein product [[Candida] boidinii]